MASERTEQVEGIMGNVQRYLKLLLEDTRLNAAEKLTRLMSAVAISAIMLFLAVVTLVFLSLGLSMALAEVMKPLWAFIIVAAIYLVLCVVLLLARKVLIIDPIARFTSKLLLDPPEQQKPKQNND